MDRTRSCGVVQDGPEGAFAWPGEVIVGERVACDAVLHATGGAAGSRLRVSLTGWGDGSARLEQRDWNGEVIAAVPGVTDGALVELDVPWTGEHLLAIVPEGTDTGGGYLLDVDCIAGCDAPWTRHPVLLKHGLGVSNPAGGLPAYRDALQAAGYEAWSPLVVPYADSWERVQAWRAHLDGWRADGTWRRVHLIGHSMGGLDARLLAHAFDPDHQVASVTSISSPHRGAPIADRVLELVQEYGWASTTVNALLAVFAPPDADRAALEAQLAQLSLAGMEAFNAEVLDRPDVAYRSWSSVTCNLWAWSCQAAWDGEVVGMSLLVPYVMMEGMGWLDNDGLVSIDSAIWGEHQGVLAADHLDSSGGGRPPFDDVGFIVREAERLSAWERGVAGPEEPQARPW